MLLLKRVYLIDRTTCVPPKVPLLGKLTPVLPAFTGPGRYAIPAGASDLGHGMLCPIFAASAEYLGSGRRVQGREAIACDAEGAHDTAAGTGTLARRGRRVPAPPPRMTNEPARSGVLIGEDGAGASGGASPRPESGAGSAGPAGAQRRRLIQLRADSATGMLVRRW